MITYLLTYATAFPGRNFHVTQRKSWDYYNKKNPVELKHCETSSSCRVFYLMKLKPDKQKVIFNFGIWLHHMKTENNYEKVRLHGEREDVFWSHFSFFGYIFFKVFRHNFMRYLWLRKCPIVFQWKQYNCFESIHVFESIQAIFFFMQIAFRKLLEFGFLFSRRKSMFVCWRSFYPFLNEKEFLFRCNCCIETRFSRCLPQECAAFTVLICWLQLSEHVDITVLLTTCNA